MIIIRPRRLARKTIARMSFDDSIARCFFPEYFEKFNLAIKSRSFSWNKPF